MEPERLDGFLHGFIAGYREASPEDAQVRDEAVEVARMALERKGEYQCISCGQHGIVILDGYFCEGCSPGLAEVQRDLREGEG